MKTKFVSKLEPSPPVQTETEEPLRLMVAPDLIGQDHHVIREDDESDEEYAARCELFARIVEAARRP